MSTDVSTITRVLTTTGFRSLFEGGREADEGFYAFQNEMSSRTSEFDEIIFNLRVIAKATERLIDNGAVDDQSTYDFLAYLSTAVDRIERNGPGYDESKQLCSLIWEIFAGWNATEGDLGGDPIERAIGNL